MRKRKRSKKQSAATRRNFAIFRLKGAIATIEETSLEGMDAQLTKNTKFFKTCAIRQIERIITSVKSVKG